VPNSDAARRAEILDRKRFRKAGSAPVSGATLRALAEIVENVV
jgi:hypothetical protein